MLSIGEAQHANLDTLNAGSPEILLIFVEDLGHVAVAKNLFWEPMRANTIPSG